MSIEIEDRIPSTNTQHLRGRKSPHGLAMSARNATKHGLTSKTFCLGHNEDAKLFATHRDEFYESLRPADPHEMHLVNQMVENAWLLCRARAQASAALRMEVENQRDHHHNAPFLEESDLSYLGLEALEKRNNTYGNLIRYAASFERAYQRAARALEISRKNQTQTLPPPSAYHTLDPDSFFVTPTKKQAPDETNTPNPSISNTTQSTQPNEQPSLGDQSNQQPQVGDQTNQQPQVGDIRVPAQLRAGRVSPAVTVPTPNCYADPKTEIMTRRDFLPTIGAAAVAAPAIHAQPTQRPNIIILFADDLGYGDLSCYGNPVIRTPHLDRMASEGTRFTSFYAAAAVCTPSRAGLLTGRNPIRAGQPNNTGPETTGGLPLTEILLPQALKPLGYRTMAIGKWHLGHQPAAQLPTSRGFDSWFGLPYSNDMIPPWVKTNVPLRLYRNAEPVEESPDQSKLTERYTAEAVKFIEASKDPFFLYLPYAMPHLPVSASSFKDKSRNGPYGDAVETLDWSAGEILATLAKNNLDRNTLVVFCSDNGPWHDLPPRMISGGVQPWHTGTKGPLRGAKGTSYEGGPRVPGILRWPGIVQANMINMDMAATLDLFPTILAAAGGTLPKDRVYDGYDLMPTLRGEKPSPRREYFYVLGNRVEAIREGPWKFRMAKPGERELYHLEHDPGEQYNRADTEADIAARLETRLLAYRKEVGATA